MMEGVAYSAFALAGGVFLMLAIKLFELRG